MTGKEITTLKFFALDTRANLKRIGMTQKELSEKIGLTEKHLSNVMNGKGNITFQYIYRIANLLKFNPRFYDGQK